MKRPPKRVIIAIIVIVIILLIWSGSGFRDPPAVAVADKVWVSGVKTDSNAPIRLKIFVADGDGIVGQLFAHRTIVDRVRWTGTGDQVEVKHLHLRKHVQSRVEIWSCKEGESPDPSLVYCMRFGGKRFYGADLEEASDLEKTIGLRIPVD